MRAHKLKFREANREKLRLAAKERYSLKKINRLDDERMSIRSRSQW
jgi:hypothetical protein